jgi:hypothetical protein
VTVANPKPEGTPSDAGKTSGGGSLGHDLPDDAERQTNVRNRGGASRERKGAQSETPEPRPEPNE